MERNQPPTDHRGTSERQSRVKQSVSKGNFRGVLFACGSLYFIVSLFGAVSWSLQRRTAKEDVTEQYSADLVETTNILAVVVPTHAGDIDEAIVALSRWPHVCSSVSLHRMQLVLYYSGAAGDGVWSEDIVDEVAKTGGRCFKETRIIFADLEEKDNVYPKGPSVMFYKMFLDDRIVRSFEGYDAFVILEWDVVVAHPTSFERLYHSAFHASEGFWVKGSTLTGAEFHDTATVPGMWHILGHLNGNAIYNNTDPQFNEFVNYTLSRWKYTYPYDVALWATISDFPYSWPLWQRYSAKFVATQLIANIGFNDVAPLAMDRAISQDALFIHGSSDGGGSITNHAVLPSNIRGDVIALDCTSACGSADTDGVPGMSTVCDSSCAPEWSSAGPRFDGHGCGASDPSRFGKTCRKCYTSPDAALAEERRLSSPEAVDSKSGVHVVMCSTGNPPQASECSDDCLTAADAVCDYRCGSGVYEDLHCNWRGLGQTCRYCFRDAFQAHLADENSKSNGSSAILCSTHEPPVFSDDSVLDLERGGVGRDESLRDLRSEGVTIASDVDAAFKDTLAHSESILVDEMCAFMLGYYEFWPETNVAVSSVLHFMPGMRVGMATNPEDFHVFNRTIGHHASVNIVNSSYVAHAALNADKACGAGTRLIYYMDVGEVLSRSFTAKDTHTPKGDLIVAFTSTEGDQTECVRRATATSILLGFSSPCFTIGSDLILPAEMNGQLREVLQKSEALTHARDHHSRRTLEEDDELTGNLATVAEMHGRYATIYIPEVLAALAFARNVDSLVFSNPKKWVVDNLFVPTSIWDIPLIKPRFGCNFDLMLSLSGYDLGERMAKEVESFKLGLKCETGFRAIPTAELNVKTNREFGVDDEPHNMPELQTFRVSVVYCTSVDDAFLFEMSIQTVIEHFPSAYELVAVVEEEEEARFVDIMDRHRNSAPFPLRLITEQRLMDDGIKTKYCQLRVDLHASGDYVLNLDSDAVLLQEVTYLHMFHLGKPFLPFRRYRSENYEDLQASMCWQKGTSFAVGQEVLHNFDTLNTHHVYPRSMYSAARHFIEEHHQKSLGDFMLNKHGRCLDPDNMANFSIEDRTEMFSVFDFIGAFLWYHMYDAVYWLPADPWDMKPEQWRPDPDIFAWVAKIED